MKLRWKNRKQKQKKQRGSILAMTALSLTAFLGAAGMSVDINHLYSASSELQNAADMAAISAVSALNNTTKGVTEATNRAVAAMNKVDFDNANVTITRDNVRFAVNLSAFDNGGQGMTEDQAKASPNNVRFAKVTLSPQSVNVYFAGYFLGANSVAMTKTAVAGASVGVTPENAWLVAPVQDDTSAHGPLSVFSGGQACQNNWQYTPGCTYNLDLMGPCQVLEGKYLLLNEDSSRGLDEDVWWRRVAIGLDQAFCPGAEISTWNHPKAGQVKKGTNLIFDKQFGNNEAAQAAEFPPDLNIAQNITYQNYKANSPTTAPDYAGLPDRRIAVLPIINKSSWYQVDEHIGRATVVKYGVFFITKEVSGANATIRAEMISDPIVMGAGSSGCQTVSQQITVPVLYK